MSNPEGSPEGTPLTVLQSLSSEIGSSVVAILDTDQELRMGEGLESQGDNELNLETDLETSVDKLPLSGTSESKSETETSVLVHDDDDEATQSAIAASLLSGPDLSKSEAKTYFVSADDDDKEATRGNTAINVDSENASAFRVVSVSTDEQTG